MTSNIGGSPSNSTSSDTSSNNVINLVFPSYPVRRSDSSWKTIASLLQNGVLSDVIFHVGGKYIPAHRLLLALRSSVFEKLFYGPFKTIEKVLKIPLSSADIFERVLMYIYTNEIALQTNNVVEIMLMAHKYELTFLEDKCERFISRYINFDETVQYYGQLFSLNTFFLLKERLLQWISDQFIFFKTRNSFLPISDIDALRSIIARLVNIDCIDAGQLQYDLFDMLINWGKFQCTKELLEVNANNIRAALNGLEQLLDFRQMPKELFTRCLDICPSFFMDDESRQFYAHLNAPMPTQQVKYEADEQDGWPN